MSGFAFLYHRNGRTAQPSSLEPMMAMLKHRGQHGTQIVCHGPFGLGHHHFWTTEEDVGEKQPLHDEKTGCFLLFDGRIDNREELANALGIRAKLEHLSDATLVFRCLLRFQEKALELLLGPYALILVDPNQNHALLARDPVGDRTLFYHLGSGILVAASEEAALLDWVGTQPKLDPHRTAAFFALSPPPPQKTFFQNILEIEPGHALNCHRQRSQYQRFWTYHKDHESSHFYRTESDAIAYFRHLLTQAVTARCRTNGQIGIMLSGGLDSTTIAGLATENQGLSNARKLSAFSYIFPSIAQADESKTIGQVCTYCHMQSFTFCGDNAWPANGLAHWQLNPNTPEDNLFRLLLDGIHQLARKENYAVLLSGDFGDHHFAGYQRWLWESLLHQRFLTTPGRLWEAWQKTGWKATLRSLGLKRWHERQRSFNPPPFLTNQAQSFWVHPCPIDHQSGAPFKRAQALLSPMAARSFSAEQFRTAGAHLDIRNPYRDRRLIRFSLGLPAYYLYRGGQKKWLLKKISHSLFPDHKVQLSPNQNLEALYRLGIEKEGKHLVKLLNQTMDLWRPWVKPEFVFGPLEGRARGNYPHFLWWQCLTFAKWSQFHWPKG